jgi:hypothetical protein
LHRQEDFTGRLLLYWSSEDSYLHDFLNILYENGFSSLGTGK